MSQQAMWRRRCWRRLTRARRERRSRRGIESRSDRGPRSSGGKEPKIIRPSTGTPRGYCSLSAMSTGPGGDCGMPFFPDDSDLRATDQPISLSEARPAEEPILRRCGRFIDHEQAN